VCLIGLLDHADPIAGFDPVFQMPFHGVHFSSFIGACTYGRRTIRSPTFPCRPLSIASPRLMESSGANGKIVVRVRSELSEARADS
jgi:hypothetical protein